MAMKKPRQNCRGLMQQGTRLLQLEVSLDAFDLGVELGLHLIEIGNRRQGSLHAEVELDLGLRARR